jgi:hypothetical protein
MLYVSNYNGLQDAIDHARFGDVIVHDSNENPPTEAVNVHKPCTILFTATLDCERARDHGVYIVSDGVTLLGLPSFTSIVNTYLSGVFVGFGIHDFRCEWLSIENYNTSNTNGNAGLFLYGNPNPIVCARIYNLKTLGGNGNGLRIGNANDLIARDCHIELTKGQSAEGVTVNGSDIDIDRLTVVNALTTGVLVYPDRNLTNVRLRNLIVKNSSQAVLAPPLGISQKGNNFAVEVQLQQFSINGLFISNLWACDDQAVPTQQGPLKIGNNNLKGTVHCGPITWYGYGNKTSGIEYVFDNKGTEFIQL